MPTEQSQLITRRQGKKDMQDTFTSENIDQKANSSTAHAISHITNSPLVYQTSIKAILSQLDLTGIKNAVIPFEYDGSAWLGLSSTAKIERGSLNNKYAPWMIMLYVLRDNPLFLYDEMRESRVDKNDYQMYLNLTNLFMRKLSDMKENDRRRYEEDDIYVCASRFMTIADSADWSDRSLYSNGDLKNDYRMGSKTLNLSRTKKQLEDASERLEGAYFCDLDPFVHATMMLQHENGLYSKEDTLWMIMPEIADQEEGNRLAAQFAPILHNRGGRFLFISELDSVASHEACVEAFFMTDGEKLYARHEYTVTTFQIGSKTFVAIHNL